MSEYGYSVGVTEGYDEAVVRTRLALRGEGFSILTEMHVGGLLGPDKQGARQYLIMGVWNPEVARERLGSDLQIAVHLPCNVVVQESGTTAIVAANDPVDLVGGEDPNEAEAALQARGALERVLKRVAEPGRG